MRMPCHSALSGEESIVGGRTAASEVFVPHLIPVDEMERPLYAFWADVDVSVARQRGRRDPETLLRCRPLANAFGDVVMEYAHGWPYEVDD